MRPGDPLWGREPEEAWARLSTDVSGVHVDGKVETVPGCYEVFYSTLRDALLQGDPLPVDPTDALMSLQVIDAARQSAREERVVPLDFRAGEPEVVT